MVKHDLVIANLPSWAATIGPRPSAESSAFSSRAVQEPERGDGQQQRQRQYFSSSYQEDQAFAPYKPTGLRDLEALYGDLEEPTVAPSTAVAKKPTQEELDEIFFANLRNSPPPVAALKKPRRRPVGNGGQAAVPSKQQPVPRLSSNAAPSPSPVSFPPAPSPRFASPRVPAPAPAPAPAAVNPAQAEADDIFFNLLRSNSAPSQPSRKKGGAAEARRRSQQQPPPYSPAQYAASAAGLDNPSRPQPHDEIPIRSKYAIQQQRALASGIPMPLEEAPLVVSRVPRLAKPPAATAASPAAVVAKVKARPSEPTSKIASAFSAQSAPAPRAQPRPLHPQIPSSISSIAASSEQSDSESRVSDGGSVDAAGGTASAFSSEVSSEAADFDAAPFLDPTEDRGGKALRTPRGVAGRVAPASAAAVPAPKNARPPQPKQQPLSVARRGARLAEDEGSVEESADTRRNLDKRTARLRYSEHFKHHIAVLREANPALNGSRHAAASAPASRQKAGVASDPAAGGVNVFVRKRPLFGYESARQDFDVVSIVNVSQRPGSAGANLEGAARLKVDKVVVHNAHMHPDMRRMLCKQSTYRCSAAFDEHCSNDDVYKSIAAPIVDKVMAGGIGTILMYGQTGSGKTFTMTGIEERSCVGLYSTSHTDLDVYEVRVKFIELVGKKALDLLSSASTEVKIVDEIVGVTDAYTSPNNAELEFDAAQQPTFKREIQVSWRGATERVAKTPNELLKLIELGKSRRATEATEVNGTSSRSHAVCQITVVNKTKATRGVLTLIDCAGSERRNDSLYHSKERQLESTEINASLYALKECIRARMSFGRQHEEKYIPYRASLLTRVLRESFEDVSATLSIIATAAPTATDTEHTMETLKTVATIVGLEKYIETSGALEVKPYTPELDALKAEFGAGAALVPPAKWNHEQLRDFLLNSNKGMFASCVEYLNKNETGKTVMLMSAIRFSVQSGLCPNNLELATELFYKLREESESVQQKLLKKRGMVRKVAGKQVKDGFR